MTETLVLAWIALGCSLVALCVGLYGLIKFHNEGDVGELARHVAALRKSNRAEQMRRVRIEAIEDAKASAPLGKDGKPFPFGPVVIPGEEHFPENTKAALRRRVFGARVPRSGNGETQA